MVIERHAAIGGRLAFIWYMDGAELSGELVQQPAVATVNDHRSVGNRRSEPRGALKAAVIGSGERAVVGRGDRQPARVDEALGEVRSGGKRQRRVAEQALGPCTRRNEIGRSRRVTDVLFRGLAALDIVAGDQNLGCLPGQNRRQFPRQVLRILNARVRAARAERRDLVRCVACKDDTTMHEMLKPPTLELVDRHPLEIEIAVPEHALDARNDDVRTALLFDIGGRSKLQIYAPDVVGLLVQQGRLPASGTADRTRTTARSGTPSAS